MSKIIEAVGVSAKSSLPGLGKIIEAAMSAAILKAAEDGVTDPVKVKELMMIARAAAKAAYLNPPKATE